MFRKLLKNKAIVFILLKYFAFGIQLINSVFIAKFLGIYYFGLFSFVSVVGQYLSYASFGVQYSYSVLCSDIATRQANQRIQITGSSISLLMCISLLLFVLHFLTDSLNLFPKYRYNEYSIFVTIIAVLQLYNTLFINVFRINGKIGTLNLYYLLSPFAQLIPLFFFKGEYLFYILLYSMLASNLLGAGLFILQWPDNLRKIPWFRFEKVGIILKRGFFLLLYNFTFFGILLSARTIVGRYFSVEYFSLFNFSNSISNAVFLLLGSLNFLFYPKLINVMSLKSSNADLVDFVNKIRGYYLTLTLLIVFLSLLSIPLIFWFLPQYKDASICLQLLMLAQLIITNSFGYTTLLVQKGKELQMSVCAAAAIFIVVAGSIFVLQYYESINVVAMCVLFGVLFYNVMIGFLANRIIMQFDNMYLLLMGIFSPSLFIPVFLCVFLMFVSPFYFANLLIVILLYWFLNRSQLTNMFFLGRNLMLRKDLFKID